MKDLSRVRQDEKGYYIEDRNYDRQRSKIYIHKAYGQILTCSICKEKHFAKNCKIKRGQGKFCSFNCTYRSFIGRASPRKNCKLLEKTKKKISKVKKEYWETHPAFRKEFLRKALLKNHSKIAIEKRINVIKKLGIFKGNKNPSWKGGRIKSSSGHILIHKPSHPFCNNHGYVLEHRLIMEKYLGRYLKPEEIVGRKNGIRDDNHIENLILFKNREEYIKFSRSKEKHPNWLGGISYLPYSSDFDRKLKNQIHKRDNYICQFPGCKVKQNGRALDTHHINYDKQNTNPMNLITLCHNHNEKVNYNRKYWTKYFQNLLKSKFKFN